MKKTFKKGDKAVYTDAQIRSAAIQGMAVEKFVSGVEALEKSLERGKGI